MSSAVADNDLTVCSVLSGNRNFEERNHEVMIRGTFAIIRLRNQLAPGTEGGFTRGFSRPDRHGGPAAGAPRR